MIQYEPIYKYCAILLVFICRHFCLVSPPHPTLSSGYMYNHGKCTCTMYFFSEFPFTTDFIDTQPSNKNSRENLAIRFHQSCAPYMVSQECRSCFQKYGGHCVACSFNMVASYSSSLRWRLVFLLVQGLSID